MHWIETRYVYRVKVLCVNIQKINEMASFIRVKEIKKRNENFVEIEKICESISELKSGVSWVIIGYTRRCELDSLSVLKEGQQWNILLQVLPVDQTCYVYARVEFGKLPGSCFIIIWTGEQVSEEKKENVNSNEDSVLKLFPKNECIIHSHSHANLNKQVAESFKSTKTRYGSVRMGRKTERKTDRNMKRYGSMHHSKTSYQTKFFLNPNGDAERSKPEKPPEKTTAEILRAKVIVVGDIDVGKSSLISTYINRYPQAQTKPTLPVEFFFKTVRIDKNVNLNLEIWDTMGEEKFSALAPIWYRYAAVALLVYDKTNRQSFKHIEDWLQRVKLYSDPHIIVLVGNKSDLLEEENIPKSEAVGYALENGLMFIETNTKDVNSIDQIFYLFSRRLIPKLLDLEEGSQCYMRSRGKTVLEVEQRMKRSDTIDLFSSFRLTNKRGTTTVNSNKCCN